jgi:hypothetical protein
MLLITFTTDAVSSAVAIFSGACSFLPRCSIWLLPAVQREDVATPGTSYPISNPGSSRHVAVTVIFGRVVVACTSEVRASRSGSTGPRQAKFSCSRGTFVHRGTDTPTGL